MWLGEKNTGGDQSLFKSMFSRVMRAVAGAALIWPLSQSSGERYEFY
jgi:hypothetical protein